VNNIINDVVHFSIISIIILVILIIISMAVFIYSECNTKLYKKYSLEILSIIAMIYLVFQFTGFVACINKAYNYENLIKMAKEYPTDKYLKNIEIEKYNNYVNDNKSNINHIIFYFSYDSINKIPYIEY
jgi:hypothetical protein